MLGQIARCLIVLLATTRFSPFQTHYSANLRLEALTESRVSTKACGDRGIRGTTMAFERLVISRNALEIIISDARDFLDTLEAAGLEQAAGIMASVLDQLARDGVRLSDTTGFMMKSIDPPTS